MFAVSSVAADVCHIVFVSHVTLKSIDMGEPERICRLHTRKD
jgi:hypothetical protein